MSLAAGITLSKIFDWLVSAIEKRETNSAQKRRAHFTDHVQPAFEGMGQIHTDYLTNLGELSQSCREMTWAPEEAVRWLRTRSIQYSAERSRLRSIYEEVTNSRMVAPKPYRTETEAQISTATVKFADAILMYFDSGHRFETVSWYSRFLEKLESDAKFGANRAKVIALGIDADGPEGPPDGDERYRELGFQLDNIVSSVLPERYRAICDAYSALRGLCL